VTLAKFKKYTRKHALCVLAAFKILREGKQLVKSKYEKDAINLQMEV
jgi:hypothetical protein